MKIPRPFADRPTFAWLAENFDSLAEELGFPPRLKIRTVAAQTYSGEWAHFATLARLTDEAVAPPTQLNLDRLRLFESVLQIPKSTDRDVLRRSLVSWREALAVSSGYPMQDSFSPRRIPSHNGWSEAPAYEITLQEEVPRVVSENSPDGPFFLDSPQLFGENAGEVAAKWLGEPTLAHHTQTSHSYQLVLPDRRLWLNDLEFADGQLKIRISGKWSGKDVHCIVRATDSTGTTNDAVVRTPNNELDLSVPRYLSSLKVWLIADGDAMDWFEENDHWSRWKRSVIHARQGLPEDQWRTLQNALRRGESDTIEFKPWILAQKADSKMQELLESAVAFANTRGGAIFVGVTDNGEPVGVRDQLRRAYQQSARGDETEMMNQYATDLRRIMSEGIDPGVDPVFTWIANAAQPILMIVVTGRRGVMHTVVQTGNVHVRAGGTNRKLRHADAAARLVKS